MIDVLSKTARFLSAVHEKDIICVDRLWEASVRCNYDYLIQKLDEVITFSNKLKNELNELKRLSTNGNDNTNA